jgi:DNA-binding NarL/FixJ family response regulator
VDARRAVVTEAVADRPAARDGGSERFWPAAPILVVLADDHVAMRRSLRLLLDGELGIRVVAEAADLGDAARLLSDHRPHVLVLDLGLSARPGSEFGGTGLEFTMFVRSSAPATQVVLVTMQEHGGFVSRAFDAGALGFVRKDLAEAELPDAVRAAARGERYSSARFVGW